MKEQQPIENRGQVISEESTILSSLTLESNPVLDELLAGIENTSFNWERIIDEYRKTKGYLAGKDKSGTLPGSLAEIYLKRYLENWAMYTNSVSASPIPYKTTAGQYIFEQGEKGSLPEGEIAPSNTDLLVILGK